MTQASLTRAAALLCMIVWFTPCLALATDIRPLSVPDHYQHPMPDKFYTESWGYHFRTDTGENMSISFVFSNVGVTSGSAGVQFTYAAPGSDLVILKDERKQSEFKEDRQAGVISIGPHSIRSEGDLTHITFSAKGVRADFTIRPWMPGFTIGDGTTVINTDKAEFNRMFIEIPRGDFEGPLTIRGQTRWVSGALFMEHTLNNVPATSYSKYWYSLRAFFPVHTVIFVGFRYLPGAGRERWDLGYVTDRNRLLGASNTCRVEPSGAYTGSKSRNVPSSFAVDLSEGDMRLSGTYQSMDMYSCTPVLQNMNWLLRKAISVFAGDPLIYRFRANATLFLQKPDDQIRLEGPAYQGVVTMKD